MHRTSGITCELELDDNLSVVLGSRLQSNGASPLFSLCSVSRETLKSRKKSDYSLNKVNAPILTNTTLNVIRLVGE